jgi:hypothetical protein
MSGRKRKLEVAEEKEKESPRDQAMKVFGILKEDVVEEIPANLVQKNGLKVLAIGQSGIRCAEIVRILKGKNLFTAKLFAKHLKFEDQKNELMDKQKNYQAAAGTPNRLIKLAEELDSQGKSILDTSKLEIVVIDLAKDAKQFTLLTQPQVKVDAKEFFEKFIKPYLKSGKTGKIKVVFLE